MKVKIVQFQVIEECSESNQFEDNSERFATRHAIYALDSNGQLWTSEYHFGSSIKSGQGEWLALKMPTEGGVMVKQRGEA